ncbi:MAG: PBP1A family penicillin-binding protein [bacterium]|nr:PBP1A family penicillin-binding protein [bacterium]
MEKILLAGLLLYSVFLGVILGFMYLSLTNLTGIMKLEDYKPSLPTKVYDIKGRLISEYFEEQREIIPLKDVPEFFIKGLVAVEDKSFYSHKGINFQGIARAFIVNILSGYIREGGSTLTQQLAKVLFTSREQTYFRKLKEVWLALQLEKLYTKDEILEFYVNEMYFGHGAYGIEAASHLYFNKYARKLDLAECALLACLHAAPNKYSPLRNPRLAMQRQWKVLKDMVHDHIITRKQAEESYYEFWLGYKTKIISPNISLWEKRVDNAPYFTEYIRQKVEDEFGANTLYKEGLKIYTTLNLDYQIAAQNALQQKLEQHNNFYFENINRVKKFLDKNFTDPVFLLSLILDINKINAFSSRKDINRFNFKFRQELMDKTDIAALLLGMDDIHKFIDEYRSKVADKLSKGKVEGALISIEPSTGYIQAMVGGSGFSVENQLNRAVQARRQVGSAFKPFVYMVALDSGLFNPASTFIDEPILYIDREGKEWIPNNYTGKYYGLVTLRKALGRSINIISVKLADALGVDKVRALAAQMLHVYNFEEQNKYLADDLSLALGTASVTPLQMANAFAIIANNGRDVIPFSIRFIKDKNNNLVKDYEHQIQRKFKAQILTPQICFLLTEMLKSVLQPEGTGWNAVCETGYIVPSVGKTGTTDNWKDTWFVGYNKKLTTAVWVGFDDPSISLGLDQAGGSVAAPIWMNYMKEVFRNVYLEESKPPEGLSKVTICLDSGKLPSSYCKNIGPEYFLKGTESSETCTECKEGYKKYDLNAEKIDDLLNKQRVEQKEKYLEKQFKGLRINRNRFK